jgi:NADPH2:quinone reductase
MEGNVMMGVRGPESLGRLSPIEGPVPEPGEGEILVRVEKAGIAFGDILRCEGKVMRIKRFPMVPGYDVAGRVAALGLGVSGFAIGDRVGAYTQTGGYARFVAARAALCVKLPDGVDASHAVALNLNYVTALQMLKRTARVESGQRIYADSAAGGVGSAILDLARDFGAKAYGSCSRGKLDAVRSFGAEAIDREDEGFEDELRRIAGEGFDAAFEGLGPASASATRELVRKGGRLVLYGFIKTRESRRPYLEMLGSLKLFLFPKGRRFSLYSINPFRYPERFIEDYGYILRRAASGALKPLIGAEFPLEKAGEAQALLARGGARGKIVLDCA